MSSEKQLKRFVKVRAYKERSQPQERAKLGMLEKKQDYKKRAVDFHRKQDHLDHLRRKAALRNPDEYNPLMHTSELVKGVHRSTVQKNRTAEELSNIKRQDIGFLEYKEKSEKNRIAELQSSLHGLDAASETPRKHVIFVRSKQEARSFDAAKHFDTAPELLHRSYNRLTNSQLEDSSVVLNKKGTRNFQKAEQSRKRSYEEMQQREHRNELIENTSKKLKTHKMLTGKGRRKKLITKDIFGEEIKAKTVWKFKQERKK